MDLGAHGTTLIVGANGDGKSTLLDALSFCLYGKPFRKVTKGLLVNSINKKDLLVECEFTIGDTAFVVRRGIKPNVFEVEQDGVLTRQDSTLAEQQDYLERYVLKMNHRACMQVVILGSASFVPFMELTAAHRREVLEDLLDVKVLSAMADLAKPAWTEVQASHREVQDRVAMAVQRVRDLEKFADSARESEAERKQYHVAAAESYNDKARAAARDVVRLMEEIEALREREDPDLSARAHAAKFEVFSVSKSASDLREKREYFESSSLCDQCGREIDEDHRTKSLDEISDREEALAKKMDEAAAAAKRVEEEVEAAARVKAAIDEKKSEVRALKAECAAMTSAAQAEMAAAEAVSVKMSSSAETDLASAKATLTALNEDLSKSAEEKAALQLVIETLRDGGVKTKIVDRYVPVLNGLINKYLAELDFFVQFELDSEFNETIKSRFRDEFKYNSFSEGEKMRINLAILFAWRAVARARNSAATNVVIMDEIFDSSLDPNGVDELMKLVKKMVGDTSVIMISHKNDQISDQFDRVIKFEKTRNFSRIAQ